MRFCAQNWRQTFGEQDEAYFDTARFTHIRRILRARDAGQRVKLLRRIMHEKLTTEPSP